MQAVRTHHMQAHGRRHTSKSLHVKHASPPRLHMCTQEEEADEEDDARPSIKPGSGAAPPAFKLARTAAGSNGQQPQQPAADADEPQPAAANGGSDPHRASSGSPARASGGGGAGATRAGTPPLKKLGKNPAVVTDFLPDRDRARLEAELRSQLKKVRARRRSVGLCLGQGHNRPLAACRWSSRVNGGAREMQGVGLPCCWWCWWWWRAGVAGSAGQGQGRASGHCVQLLGRVGAPARDQGQKGRLGALPPAYPAVAAHG